MFTWEKIRYKCENIVVWDSFSKNNNVFIEKWYASRTPTSVFHYVGNLISKRKSDLTVVVKFYKQDLSS